MRSSLLTLTLLGFTATPSFADPAKPTYDQDVLPVFKQYCTNCHGNDKQKSDLNLATYASVQKGGSSGAVVVPGNPDKSRLYKLVAHLEEPKMPSEKTKIPDAQLSLLKLWIEQGARENAAGKVLIPAKTAAIGLKSVTKGRPAGPPPMPAIGKLKLDPFVKARRPGAVTALATSPWAPLVAIGGQHQVILYNTDTAQIAGILPFEHGQINCIRFSRNGQFVLAAGGRGGQSGKAVLYKVENGEKVIEVGIESDALLSADISADQTQIAVGSPSKLIRVYSTTDGKVIRTIKKHTDWVTAVQYSPDGVLLATGDRNGGLFVWEAFTGREYFSLRGHSAMITDLSWRDDSNVLASSSEDDTLRLWEMENGRNFKNWRAHGGGVSSVSFAHNGQIATTGRDKLTKLWDQNGAVKKTFEAFPDLGLQVAVTHENAKVIAGDWSGMVKEWNAADAKVIAVLDANPPPAAERARNAAAAVVAAETRAKAAQVAFDAASTNAKRAADAHSAAIANLNKIKAGLAAAKKSVVDFGAAAKAAKPLADAAKAEVNKQAPVAAAAAKKATALEIRVATAAGAAKAAADAAAKAPTNKDLAAKAKKATESLAAISKERDAAKTASNNAAAALKAATDKHAGASKKYTDAIASLASARKTAAALAPMVKPATDAIAPAKKAAEAANKAAVPPKAALDAANSEVAAAKASLAFLKASLTAPVPAPAPPPPPKKK